jgi:hypothetical protein
MIVECCLLTQADAEIYALDRTADRMLMEFDVSSKSKVSHPRTVPGVTPYVLRKARKNPAFERKPTLDQMESIFCPAQAIS